ncbi:MAG: hypothetical protein RR058_07375 [Oscillospiraceae bacterium]
MFKGKIKAIIAAAVLTLAAGLAFCFVPIKLGFRRNVRKKLKQLNRMLCAADRMIMRL